MVSAKEKPHRCPCLYRPISHRLFIFGTSFSEFIEAAREVETVINLEGMI